MTGEGKKAEPHSESASWREAQSANSEQRIQLTVRSPGSHAVSKNAVGNWEKLSTAAEVAMVLKAEPNYEQLISSKSQLQANQSLSTICCHL